MLLLITFLSPLLMAIPITITMEGTASTVEIDGIVHNDAAFIYRVFVDDSQGTSAFGQFRPSPGFEFSFNFLGIKDLGRSTSHSVFLVQQDLANRFLTDVTESNTGFSFNSPAVNYTDPNILASFTQSPITGTMDGALNPSSGNVVVFENGILDGLAVDANATATLTLGDPLIPEPSTYLLGLIAVALLTARKP